QKEPVAQRNGVALERRQQRFRLAAGGFGRLGLGDEEIDQQRRDGARQRVSHEQQGVGTHRQQAGQDRGDYHRQVESDAQDAVALGPLFLRQQISHHRL